MEHVLQHLLKCSLQGLQQIFHFEPIIDHSFVKVILPVPNKRVYTDLVITIFFSVINKAIEVVKDIYSRLQVFLRYISSFSPIWNLHMSSTLFYKSALMYDIASLSLTIIMSPTEGEGDILFLVRILLASALVLKLAIYS